MSYNTIEGKLDASGLKFAIVVARFNRFITERLLDGAMDGIVRHGGKAEDVDVVRVPGSWELPLTVAEVAKTKKYDAILCLGAVIRGDTPHFDYVAGEAAKGVGQVAKEFLALFDRLEILQLCRHRRPLPTRLELPASPPRLTVSLVRTA